MKASAIALLMLSVAAPMGCRNSSERASADFERMRRQQRTMSYGPSSAFANGMALRVPPQGTISRELFATGDAEVPGRQNGGHVSRMTLSLTSDQRRQGARDFQVYCAVCHGENGSATTVVGSNLRPPPPSLLVDSIRRLSDGELFAIISQGRGRMPPYNWALPPIERWAVIATLRSLQGAQ